ADFIGESNFFDARVTDTNGDRMDIVVEGVAMRVRNRRRFSAGQDVQILLRPEDMLIRRVSNDCEHPYFPGRVEEMIYKGNTVDLVIRLDSGKRISTTEFFNEDAEEIFYAQNEAVCVSWIQGWEVILPNE
ncbi:MAG: TOBE domain-containing protein, partial [Desulfobacterales bacterium]|nr:TOBE domain-containing protein [Desulfobacterales bacterium]